MNLKFSNDSWKSLSNLELSAVPPRAVLAGQEGVEEPPRGELQHLRAVGRECFVSLGNTVISYSSNNLGNFGKH